MLLTCPKCQSRYNVDPSAMSDEGTYAHCATCENIFFVRKKRKEKTKPPIDEATVGDTVKEEESVEPTKAPAAVVEENSEQSAQDEIDALMAGSNSETKKEGSGQDEPAQAKAQPAEAEKEEEKPIIKQEDLDALLDSTQPATTEPATAKEEVEEDSGQSAQDEIDALMAGAGENLQATPEKEAPKEPEPAAVVEEESGQSAQDEIDALMAGSNSETKEESSSQDEPAQAEAQPAEAEKSGEETYITRDDIESLLTKDEAGAKEQEAVPAEQAADVTAMKEEKEEKPIISQDDLDALFDSTQPATTEPATAKEEEEKREEPEAEAVTEITSEEKEVESLFESESANISADKEKTEEADAEQLEQTKVVTESAEGSSAVDTSMFENREETPEENTAEPVQAEASAEAEAEANEAEAETPKDEKTAIITPVTKLEQKTTKKADKKFRKLILPTAAVLLLTIGASFYYFTTRHAETGGSVAKEEKQESTVVAKTENVEEKPASPLPAEELSVIQTSSNAQPPQPQMDEIVETAQPEFAASEEEKNDGLKVGIIIPVDFNARAVRVLTADLLIKFKNRSDMETAETKRFFYEMETEKEIELFFKERFYENTHYVQDKLVAALYAKFKKRSDMESITEIAINNFNLD